MKKSAQIGIAVLIIAIIGIGVGIGVYFVMNPSPSPEEDVILTIKGTGTTNDFTLTMSELKSSKYRQFENQFYARSSDRNATYSGVSIKDILEKESLLTGDAINYTFISAEGYNSAVEAGYFLNTTALMNAEYDDCIFAYGGIDYVPEEDGFVRSIINMTIYPDLSVGKFWNKNCSQMYIIAAPEPEEVAMTIWGSGTTGSFSLTMSEFKSGKYQTFENLLYNRSSTKSGTYSGVSIRDILEKESLLTGGAVNYTFIAADGYDSADRAGYFLNITELMSAEYDDCIFAYGGTDFDPLDDGPLRSIINISAHPGDIPGPYWNSNCTQMQIIGEPFITIWGSGTTGSFSLTMSEFKSGKYQTFENLLYNRSSTKSGIYSGVSIRDILEKESLLTGGAVNYTFIAADGYDSADHAGYFLNITELMSAEYDDCIFAYGGTDFDPLEDGPLRSIINMSAHPGDIPGAYWNRNCTEMQIIGEPFITIWGSGTTGSLSLIMTRLQSNMYQQFVNLLYNRSSTKSGTYSGVSIRDILEKESLLTGGAVNYTFIAADGYDSADHAGYFLNITELMSAEYDDCIFAYGGTDFDPLEDGPFRSIINMTAHPGDIPGAYWNRNCVEMQILA